MIRGFMKTSFVDYPGKICSTVFIGGCNFRCPYCHNPGLVFNKEKEIPFSEVVQHLQRRKGKIDAVCITGGEPLFWEGIFDLVKEVKGLGLFVKIDTNGTNPRLLLRMINKGLVDYVAMDIKAPASKYQDVIMMKVNVNDVMESIKIIMKSDVDYEFRTTVHSGCISVEDLLEIAKEIKGAKRYIMQEFKGKAELLDNSYANTNTINHEVLEEVRKQIIDNGLIKEVRIR